MRIPIGTAEYPIRIDYNVLEAIEEEFETLEKFKMELLGFRWKKDASGYVLNDEGKPIPEFTKPNLKAIRFILPLMINEGLKYEAFEQGKVFEPVDEERIMMECEIERNYLMEIINDEIDRCQKVKKNISSEGGKSRKKSTSRG